MYQPMYHLGMGNNALSLYRRHLAACSITAPTRYPSTPKDVRADQCHCPIVASGHLIHEAKRVRHLSLGTNDWAVAQQVKTELERAGRLRAERTTTKPTGDITVKYAAHEYLKSRTEGSDVIRSSTLSAYKVLLHGRLLPWCDENKIVYLKEFEDPHTVRRFDQSWKNLKSPEQPLGKYTRKTIIQAFRTFGRYCLENKWTGTNVAKIIKPPKKASNEAESKRFGLEIFEYENVLRAIDGYPKYGHIPRLRAFVELCRWTGMRISDATKFRRSELVRNLNDDGWDADFIQKKTGKRCVSPVPNHVTELLLALPFRSEQYWFWNGSTLELAIQAWANRVANLFEQAEKIKPFRHHASAHSLRHTFAIHYLNKGVKIPTVSKWLGHQSVAITMDHYANAIESTMKGMQDESREAQRKIMAEIEALRNPNKVVTIRKPA
jgi:site-specific recombinase XerD